MGKNMLYDSVYRIPLILRWPGRLPGKKVISPLVSQVDFAPTLLRLMGMEVPADMEGKDASALLSGKEASWKEEVQIYHSSNNAADVSMPVSLPMAFDEM